MAAAAQAMTESAVRGGTVSRRLKLAFTRNPRCEALVAGCVRLQGAYELEWELERPSSLFRRLMARDDADVFEMSLVNYLVARNRPDLAHLDWVALPVFLGRAIFPLRMQVRDGAGIDSLQDLAGHRVAVQSYTMAAAVWLRVMLHALFGVRPGDVTWVVSQRRAALGDAGLPEGVRVEAGDGHRPGELVRAGAADAGFDPDPERGESEHASLPGAHRLLDDAAVWATLRALYQKTGATPLNHVLVLQRRLLISDPDLPAILYDGFERARRATPADRCDADDEFYAALLGGDPFPPGLTANQPSIDLLQRHLVYERLLDNPPDLDRLFVQPVASHERNAACFD
jgi:4,5-dihydroxyphthalate decarboxylase